MIKRFPHSRWHQEKGMKPDSLPHKLYALFDYFGKGKRATQEMKHRKTKKAAN